MSKSTNRISITLEGEQAAKLKRLAIQTRVSPGTLARSLLSRALDEVEPSASTLAAVLDSIDGAFEQARAGTADLQAGRYVRLDEI